MFVYLNEIGVKAMIDTGATHSCLVTLVVAKLNMRIEPHASVIIPLNGTNLMPVYQSLMGMSFTHENFHVNGSKMIRLARHKAVAECCRGQTTAH